MNKGLKIAIGVAVLGVTGVGLYFLYTKVIKPKMQKKLDQEKEDEEKNNPKPVSESYAKSKGSRNSGSRSSEGKTPFKSKTEGNKFRQWVNDTYPKYAEKIKLDPTGEYDNSYIRKAWEEYGKDYETANKNKGAVYNVTFGSKFKKVMDDWNKSHKLSEANETKDVPYITIPMKDNIGEKWNDITLYVYDRLKGESIGGKGGQGYWKVQRKGYGKTKVIAKGRWDDNLRHLVVTHAVHWSGKPSGQKGQVYSGGKEVGAKFKQILSSPTMTWA